jgi:hypothetical protein
MAECTNSEWRINMTRNSPPGFLQTLFFRLNVGEGGALTGEVFLAGSTTRLSTVSGMCRPIDNPDATVITLSFTWNAVDIFMVGVTHFVDPINQFDGTFIATQRDGLSPLDFNPTRAELAAGPGDTGTGTGQQT